MGRRQRLLVAVMVGLLMAGAGGAAAETRSIEDPNEYGAPSDVSRVTVVHKYGADGAGGRVVVRADVGNVTLEDRFAVWIDVPGGASPDFYSPIPVQSDGFLLSRVDGWSRSGPTVSCRRWSGRAMAGRDQTIVLSLPRRCLGNPDRVRVTFLARYAFATRVVNDWAPARRTLGPWVPVS